MYWFSCFLRENLHVKNSLEGTLDKIKNKKILRYRNLRVVKFFLINRLMKKMARLQNVMYTNYKTPLIWTKGTICRHTILFHEKYTCTPNQERDDAI